MPQTIFDIRRENLRRLMEQWGGPTSLSTKLGYANASYMAQLAGPNPTRAVSEKVAKHIEQVLDLPQGWLDASTAKSKGEIDTELLISVVLTSRDALEQAGLALPPKIFSELVNLVYEQADQDGTINHDHLQRLVRMLRRDK